MQSTDIGRLHRNFCMLRDIFKTPKKRIRALSGLDYFKEACPCDSLIHRPGIEFAFS
jgi:hypothetical protein